MQTQFNSFTDGFFETGNQVHEWVMRHARECTARDSLQRQQVVDAATFQAYLKRRRALFLKSLGGLPEERTELKQVETGRLQRQGYSIRKIIYQSLPGMYVTGCLYSPDKVETPAPAVLMACGHHKDGKASPAYQQVCTDLVRCGFVVLIIDSPSQAEMVQCLMPETGKPLVGLNTPEHSYLQITSSILGQNIARYFIWNALRGLDLLTSLPEVDSERIGMTGNSGGGTLTQYMMMAYDRVKVAMPCCSLSTREWYLATGCRAYDGEQNLFGAVVDGVDYADFLAAFAPRPARVGAAEYDFFCIEGVEEALQEARKIYRALGAEDALDLSVARGELHGYTTPLRQACVEWFCRHLQGREVMDPLPEIPPEPAQELQCTRSGQVMTEFPDARSILDLNREEWERRRKVGSAPTREGIAALVAGPSTRIPLRPRRTKRQETEHGASEHIFFFTEPGILTTAVVYLPAGAVNGAALMLLPGGTTAQEPFTDDIAQRTAGGQMVMVYDVRGTGAVKMRDRNHGKGLEFRSTEFRVASDHFLLGTSIAARRAFDASRALEYLRSRPDLPVGATLEVVGRGWPALYGLLAACAAEPRVRGDFQGLAESWSQVFQPHVYDPEQFSESLLLPEFAGSVDLPDLLKLVQG